MKIVQAVNAMIANRDKISNVLPGNGSEHFFLYDGRYKWSILQSKHGDKEDYRLFFYPGTQDLSELASWDEYHWHEFNQMIQYYTDEIGTKEARSSFSELYQVVKERQLGIDSVLDDIIGDLTF